MSIAIAVLHEDAHRLVVDKPVGLSTIAERDRSRPCLHGLLQEERQERLWIVHRIDKETSGLVLFARDQDAHRELSLLFERRLVRKSYRAVAHGVLEGAGLIDAPLRSFGSGRTGVDAVRGKPSETSWRAVRNDGSRTELVVEPRTGRRHQIRAHLHSIGHPLVGDPVYGDAELRRDPGRMLLHAESMELPANADSPLVWTAPLPSDFLLRWPASSTRT